MLDFTCFFYERIPFNNWWRGIWQEGTPPVDLYLISEKSIWKNQVRRTGILVYFELDFYCLCNLQKSISKLIFEGYTASKKSVWNRLKIQFVELDFSKLIFQKSSTDQQGVWIFSWPSKTYDSGIKLIIDFLGVADILSLAVGTASYYQKLGLLSNDVDVTDEETNINILFSMALQRLAFMPFGYLVDKYRWDLYRFVW